MNRPQISAALRVWWRRLHVMTTKEMIQLLRDPMLMFLIVYAFTADVYNAGSGVTLQLKQAAVAVMDQDRSAASRELLSRFQPPYFRLAGSVANERAGQRLLDDADAMLVLTIPPQFEKSLVRGEQTQVQMQIDATNSVLGFLAYSYATQIVSTYGLQAAAQRLGLDPTGGIASGVPMVQNDQRVWYNPNQNDAWFMSISEMLNVITLLALLLPAGGHGAREGARHHRTIAGLAVDADADHAAQSVCDDFRHPARHWPEFPARAQARVRCAVSRQRRLVFAHHGVLHRRAVGPGLVHRDHCAQSGASGHVGHLADRPDDLPVGRPGRRPRRCRS